MMTSTSVDVCGGVDTHGRTHHAAAVDGAGRLLGDAEFAATAAGYRSLLGWLAGFGRLVRVGVEGTGTYGAGLAGHLAGTASGAPKTRTGPVEAIRALRVARRGAVKARTAALNQLHGLLTSAPNGCGRTWSR